MCDECLKQKNMTEDEKLINAPNYDMHIERKKGARNYLKDMKEAAVKGEIIFLQFDLESVRHCPQVGSKLLFYKRRLAVFNFTIYDVGSRKATCYMWDESCSARGSNEVASCLYGYLKDNCNVGKKIVMMSDGCVGQNKNSIVSSMLIHCINHMNIPEIEHGFFEKGHSFMECDSVHGRIEKATKHKEIFDPIGWYTAVKMAGKQSGPYFV